MNLKRKDLIRPLLTELIIMILYEMVYNVIFLLDFTQTNIRYVQNLFERNRIGLDRNNDISGVIFPKHPLASEQFCIFPNHVALSTCIHHVPSLS